MEPLLTDFRSRSAVLVHPGEDDFVDLVVEDEDFDALLFVDFEQRRGAEERLGAAGDVVERSFAPRPCGTCTSASAGEAFDFGGFEADQVEEGFAVGVVAVQAFLERAVVLAR